MQDISHLMPLIKEVNLEKVVSKVMEYDILVLL